MYALPVRFTVVHFSAIIQKIGMFFLAIIVTNLSLVLPFKRAESGSQSSLPLTTVRITRIKKNCNCILSQIVSVKSLLSVMYL